MNSTSARTGRWVRRSTVVAALALTAATVPVAASAAPSPAPAPAPCSEKQSVWVGVSTTVPPTYSEDNTVLEAGGVLSGYAVNSVRTVNVFLDGEFQGTQTIGLRKAPKDQSKAPTPRPWALDVTVTPGATHELLVCADGGYGSLAGVLTQVDVPPFGTAPTL